MTHHFNDENQQQFLKKVDYLDNKLRTVALPPEKLLAMIPLTKKDTVLDLGAGTGFLTLPAAKLSKTVYALDLSTKMLELIATRAKDAKLTNIQPLNTAIENIPLEDESVNHVLASLVLHELPDLPQALAQIQRVLKTGGFLVILELAQSEHGHNHHGAPRLTAPNLTKALHDAGFTVTEENPTDSLYVLVAQK